MIRRNILVGLCVFFLGVGSVTYAADTEVTLDSSDINSGFTVKNSSGDTVMRARGDSNVGIGPVFAGHSSPGSPVYGLIVEGNVGIGTPVPTKPLHVKSATTFGTIQVDTADAKGPSVIGSINGAWRWGIGTFASMSGKGSDIDLTLGAEAGNGIKFFTNGSSSSVDMVIDTSGNVGIGNSSLKTWHPNYKAVQLGPLGAFVDWGDGGTVSLNLNTYTGSNGLFKYIASNAEAAVLQVTNGDFLFLTAPNGTADADINFTTAMRLDRSSGNLTITGTLSQGSSREFKKNISYISTKEAMDALNDLNPVRFEYKTEGSGEEHLGFIAEDVPELVATQDRKGLSPMDIAAVLTKVVQEQQKIISELSAKVRDLEDKI
ncbi:MAG: tail fiber domain-containing protein [Candidatus Scalinduaceae bacterium]